MIRTKRLPIWFLTMCLVLVSLGCGLLPSKELDTESPPLWDLNEPIAGHKEPGDEEVRQNLDPGSFSGLYVRDARDSLEAMIGEPVGLLVDRVVENSPADAAGIEVGDLLLAAVRRPSGSPEGAESLVELRWTSEWRRLEIESKAGDALWVEYDRSGLLREAVIGLEGRVRSADRHEIERFREDDRVGIVVRTATEVEARRFGLGPGGGAVVVGLSANSPWRAGGVRYGDLIRSVGGKPVSHPQDLLTAIREADEKDRVSIEIGRGDSGQVRSLALPISRRAQELREVSIPFLFSYSRDRDRTRTSFLLGLFSLRTTEAAWRVRLLWLLRFGGGDADRLAEVDTELPGGPESKP